MDPKKCYTALKKCNEVGKKFTSSSKYVMINGMMIAYQDEYDEDDKEIYCAHGLAISFIDDKLIKDLDALAHIPVVINGTNLYRMDKEYDFDRFEIDDEKLSIVFKGLGVSVDQNEAFCNHVSNKFDRDYVISQIANDFIDNIDLYEKYLDFKRHYKPQETYTEFRVNCTILYEPNKVIKKSEMVISELLECEQVSIKKLDPEIFKRIIESGKAVTMTLEADDNKYKVRLMKSLFKSASNTSEVSMRIANPLSSSDISYLLINIVNKQCHSVIVYKIISF